MDKVELVLFWTGNAITKTVALELQTLAKVMLFYVIKPLLNDKFTEIQVYGRFNFISFIDFQSCGRTL